MLSWIRRMAGKRAKKIKRKKTWRNCSGKDLGVIEMFQDHGYQASDIGIIVREVKEGICCEENDRLQQYLFSWEKMQIFLWCGFWWFPDFIVLTLINFITAALKVICDTKDIISRAQMVRFYSLSATAPGKGDLGLYDGSIADSSPDLFPEDSEHFMKNAAVRCLRSLKALYPSLILAAIRVM